MQETRPLDRRDKRGQTDDGVWEDGREREQEAMEEGMEAVQAPSTVQLE